MLTESVSDPRRANWLTITSMSEDVCWPEEPSTSRPNWELEAEILRLTTRLMMRERELRQVKSQLKAQSAKLQHQNSSWRRRMEEKEEQVKELLVQKDAEMQNIVSQLLLFEAELRREQSRIEDLLSEKDSQIANQQREIERLRRSAEDKNSAATSGDSAFSSLDIGDGKDKPNGREGLSSDSQHATVQKLKEGPVAIRTGSLDISDRKDRSDGTRNVRVYEDRLSSDSQHAVQKLRDGLVKIRAIQDVTNVKSLDSEKKRVLYRAPQKMKDLKAKRINPHHKIHHRPVMGELTAQAIL